MNQNDILKVITYDIGFGENEVLSHDPDFIELIRKVTRNGIVSIFKLINERGEFTYVDSSYLKPGEDLIRRRFCTYSCPGFYCLTKNNT